MNKKAMKLFAWVLLLAGIATLANGCFWWGPRRGWHHRYPDHRGWHEGSSR